MYFQECDSSPVSIDQRILGQVEAVTKLREIFDSVHEIPSISDTDVQSCASCAAAADGVRRVRDRVRDLGDALLCAGPASTQHAAAQCAGPASIQHAAAQTDQQLAVPTDRPNTAAQTDEALRRDLLEAERRHEEEKRKMAGLIK